MSLQVLSHSVPEVNGKRKIVRAQITLDGAYNHDGEILLPKQVSLSQIEWVDDAIGEGWLIRFNWEQPYPARLKVLGVDDDGLMAEVAGGTDLNYVDDIRIVVHGWG